MRTATRMVFDFAREGHPLGKSIYREEVPILASNLMQRLGMSESELDFTPASLKRLEDKLFESPPKMEIQNFSDEEIVQLVREVAAYVGEVLVLHAAGRWEPLGTLWSTHVVFEGNIKITKEGRRRIVPSVTFSLGNIGAAALDMVSVGKKPLLYRDYLSAKKKIVKEQLDKSER
jgi:hypothetical protein